MNQGVFVGLACAVGVGGTVGGIDVGAMDVGGTAVGGRGVGWGVAAGPQAVKRRSDRAGTIMRGYDRLLFMLSSAMYGGC